MCCTNGWNTVGLGVLRVVMNILLCMARSVNRLICKSTDASTGAAENECRYTQTLEHKHKN